VSRRNGARRVLVAGIGNVFLGDDGFGVEVVGRLDVGSLPDSVDVVDYGIRGVHLAYELLDGRYDTVILVDAVPTGEAPGTVSVLEVDPAATAGPGAEDAAGVPPIDGHGMTPMAVLAMLRDLGGAVDRVLVVGCEPAGVEERMALSNVVGASVEEAVGLVTRLARREASGAAALPGGAAEPG
jgi:hydrogenase maturation protease